MTKMAKDKKKVYTFNVTHPINVVIVIGNPQQDTSSQGLISFSIIRYSSSFLHSLERKDETRNLDQFFT